MTKSLRTFGIAFLAWLFASALVTRAADLSVYGDPAGSIVIPDGFSAPDVQKVIVDAAMGRGWTIIAREDGKVVIGLDHERWSSKLTLIYTAHDVQILSRSTRNGKPKIPDNWLTYLKLDINAKVNPQAVAPKKK